MARNLFEEKKGGPVDAELFEEYVKESDQIGKKRNEGELQKTLRSFLKGELKQIVDNFVKVNKINDSNLKERAKAFLEIFQTKFSKLFGVIFRLNRPKFLELIRVNSRSSAEAGKLWAEVSTKYEYFKTHAVLNSDLLKNFVKLFLSNALIRKEVQFFMMYHFDLVHDFDTSKLIEQIEDVENKSDEVKNSKSENKSEAGRINQKVVSNIFEDSNQPFLSEMTFDAKNASEDSVKDGFSLGLNERIMDLSGSGLGKSGHGLESKNAVQFLM